MFTSSEQTVISSQVLQNYEGVFFKIIFEDVVQVLHTEKIEQTVRIFKKQCLVKCLGHI